jgi:hypothetical protein
MFSMPTLFTGPSFQGFREIVLSKYSFKGGFVMDSANFADISSWALTFSILQKQ